VLGAIAVAALAGGAVAALRGAGAWALIPAAAGLWMLLQTASFVYTTRAGKFAVWAGLLRALDLRGDQRVLDMGCGRGAVLHMAAGLLPRGRAVGVDIWQTVDQSGNTAAATLRNAELEGVADRVDLVTGDMRALPFRDGGFDVVLSSVAIHNIHDLSERRRAVLEAARVLRPGGRLLIADFGADRYAAWLRAAGLGDARHRELGWRFWYGGPWARIALVEAGGSDAGGAG
jgi:arsenite methyltransferase